MSSLCQGLSITVLPFVPSLSWPLWWGKGASIHLPKQNMGCGPGCNSYWPAGGLVLFLLAGTVSLSSPSFNNWIIGSLKVPYRITHSLSKITKVYPQYHNKWYTVYCICAKRYLPIQSAAFCIIARLGPNTSVPFGKRHPNIQYVRVCRQKK